MLIGNWTSNITQGRRIAIPKKFRDELGERFVVARWYEKCLVLVTFNDWLELLNKITGKIEFITEPVRDTERFIIGSAFELAPDSQGRIIIPEQLYAYAGFEKDVIFVGLGNRVEIWNSHEWKEREKYIIDNSNMLLERVVTKTNA